MKGGVVSSYQHLFTALPPFPDNPKRCHVPQEQLRFTLRTWEVPNKPDLSFKVASSQMEL